MGVNHVDFYPCARSISPVLGQNQLQFAHGCCWFSDDDYGCYGDCGDDDDGDDIDGVEEQIQDQASHPSSLAHLV